MRQKFISVMLTFVLVAMIVIVPTTVSATVGVQGEGPANPIPLYVKSTTEAKIKSSSEGEYNQVWFSFRPEVTHGYQFQLLNPEFGEYGISNMHLSLFSEDFSDEDFSEYAHYDEIAGKQMLASDAVLEKGKTYYLVVTYRGEQSIYNLQLTVDAYQLNPQTVKAGGSVSAKFDVDTNHVEEVFFFTAPDNYRYEFEVMNPYIHDGQDYGGTYIEIFGPDGSSLNETTSSKWTDCVVSSRDKMKKGETYRVVVYCYGEKELILKTRKHQHRWEIAPSTGSTQNVICYVCYAEDQERATIIFNKNTFAYDGKIQTPKVTVKATAKRAGTTRIIQPYNYTVTKAKGSKNVGKYTVTVKFKNEYKGLTPLKKNYTIKPKTTAVTILQKEENAFTVKWKKRTAQINGYQICYGTSTNKNKCKKVLVKNNKTTSKTITGLKSDKKYNVWVRTYKTAKVNGKSTKIYSDWSKVKTVKVK